VTDTGSVEAPTDPGAVTIDEVVSALRVDMDEGLSADEVSRRRSSFGTNELGSVQSRPWWRLVWDQLADAVIVLLIAAAVAGFAVGEVVEAAAIGVVLVVNTIVGFATEFRAARSMESLRALMTTRAEATRDGRRDEIDAVDLVPGDLIGIEAGEQVPADARILEAEELRVDEAGLTGESEPVDKSVEPVDSGTPARGAHLDAVHRHHCHVRPSSCDRRGDRQRHRDASDLRPRRAGRVHESPSEGPTQRTACPGCVLSAFRRASGRGW